MTPPRSHPLHALADQVRACRIQADLVFLDIRNDAYFCLPGLGDVARLTRDGRSLAIDDPALAEELLAAGLLASTRATCATRDRAVAPPSRSALPDVPEVLRLGDLPQMAWSLIDLLLNYRGRGFEQLVEAGRPPPAPRAVRRSRGELLRRFHRWAPYAPVSAKCLLRSFMLLRLLRRHGHDAAWVIGIATWPFAAHCWLQQEDEILDEACERAALFEPILVV